MIKFCWWRQERNYDVITFQNTLILRRPSVAIFAYIIKIATMFIKTIFKDSKKLKESQIMYQNAIYIWISWYSKTCWLAVKKYWCQQNSGGVSRDSYTFLIFFRKGITVQSFILVRYVWQILGGGDFLPPPPPHPWAARKGPSWIGLKQNLANLKPIIDRDIYKKMLITMHVLF